MSSSQVEVCGVTRAYTAGVAALDALDLTIQESERLAVLGPSGSGKTTLLRLIAGLETPDAGTIRIGGRDTRGLPPHQRDVAMVFQNPALYPHLNVLENLAFGLKARGVGRRERRTRAGEVAEMLGLTRLLDRRPDELSGGERQRVALGRAVARKPAVLLLDEPFSNLDEPLRAALQRELLAVHHRFGSTMVHVTHDQAEALYLGERLAVLHEGRLMQLDSPATIYARPSHRFVASFVGSPGMSFIEVDVARDEKTLEVSTPWGISMQCQGKWQGSSDLLPLHEPRRLEMGVRPEILAIEGDEGLAAFDEHRCLLVLPAIVRGLEFQGFCVLVTLEVGERMILSRVAKFLKLREAQRVTVHIDVGQASWFDPATGRRLELHCQPLADSIA